MDPKNQNQSSIRIEREDKIAFWLCMAVWLLSFFLPAAVGDSFWTKDSLDSGLGAFIDSIIAFWVPIYGWVWPANIFIVLAPIFARRIEKGRGGGAYVIWLCIWAVFPLAIVICKFLDFLPPSVHGLKIGYYVWETSLLGTAAWFLWVTTRRRSVLVGAGVIMGSFWIGSLVIVPELILLQHFLQAVRRVDQRINAISGGEGVGALPNPDQDLTFLGFRGAGAEDFGLARTFLNDIYDCHGRERISDLEVLDRYPEIQVHPAEPAHVPQTPRQANYGSTCIKDNSAREPWIYYRDLQPAALNRAKLYLRNTKIDLWMAPGRRRVPEQPGSAELLSSAQPVWKELPAQITNPEGLAERFKPHAPDGIKVDRNMALQKGDELNVGTYSSATISFVGGTACTVGSDSYVTVRENSIGWSGRTAMKIRLDSGRLQMNTPTGIWRSTSQIESGGIRTIDVGAESYIEVERDSHSGTIQILLKKGSGRVLSGNDNPIQLIENEKLTLR